MSLHPVNSLTVSPPLSLLYLSQWESISLVELEVSPVAFRAPAGTNASEALARPQPRSLRSPLAHRSALRVLCDLEQCPPCPCQPVPKPLRPACT